MVVLLSLLFVFGMMTSNFNWTMWFEECILSINTIHLHLIKLMTYTHEHTISLSHTHTTDNQTHTHAHGVCLLSFHFCFTFFKFKYRYTELSVCGCVYKCSHQIPIKWAVNNQLLSAERSELFSEIHTQRAHTQTVSHTLVLYWIKICIWTPTHKVNFINFVKHTFIINGVQLINEIGEVMLATHFMSMTTRLTNWSVHLCGYTLTNVDNHFNDMAFSTPSHSGRYSTGPCSYSIGNLYNAPDSTM